MTTKLPASFLPAKFQVLSGSSLKLIAITLMLIDHTGLMILYNYCLLYTSPSPRDS